MEIVGSLYNQAATSTSKKRKEQVSNNNRISTKDEYYIKKKKVAPQNAPAQELDPISDKGMQHSLDRASTNVY